MKMDSLIPASNLPIKAIFHVSLERSFYKGFTVGKMLEYLVIYHEDGLLDASIQPAYKGIFHVSLDRSFYTGFTVSKMLEYLLIYHEDGLLDASIQAHGISIGSFIDGEGSRRAQSNGCTGQD